MRWMPMRDERPYLQLAAEPPKEGGDETLR